MRNQQKSEHGKVKIFMTKEICNSLISVLDSYIVADATNKYSVYARKLKHIILTYGRGLKHNKEENVVVFLYEDESAVLIKLFAIYINAIEKTPEDYFEQIGKTKNNN